MDMSRSNPTCEVPWTKDVSRNESELAFRPRYAIVDDQGSGDPEV